MMRLRRKHRKHTARGLLAVLTGLWLLAAAAPCVMAQPTACPQDATSNHCPQEASHALVAADDCDALTALNCRLPDPNPPSAALDIPAPAPMLLQTLPVASAHFHTNRPPSFARAAVDPPTLPLNRKQSRLLI